MTGDIPGGGEAPETLWVGAMPARIGPYRLRRKLGEGGMGVVYEAQQQQPQRLVALKVVRATALTGSARRRFDLEVAVLGRLEHPGIARIYDAGVALVGGVEQPYFAMELIDGLSILRHAEKHRLARGQRLELLAQVCDAVQYAHQKGVVHRDLKPANILVPRDGAGHPKVVDFGVARATDPDSQLTTQHTRAGDIVGTLQYMSPEQIGGDAFEVDARSDVYSLGVILYELLSGKLPHEEWRLSPLDLVRAVREEDPARLGDLEPECRGDVETIVAKALAREKERRYETAAQFAEDLRRHLRDEPILARPATTIYQLRKLARRHRPLVVGGGLAAVGLLFGAVFATWQATAATRQRDRALVAERQAQEVNDFLRDMLGSADPGRSQNADVTVVEVLDAAAATLKDRFADDPPVELAVRLSLAESYESLGRAGEAETQITRVLEMARTLYGERGIPTLNAMSFLALMYRAQDRLAEAESLALRARDGFAQAHSLEHPDAISATNNLALVYIDQADYPKAEVLLRECLAASVKAKGEDDQQSLNYLANLASVVSSQGRDDEAGPYWRKVLAGRTAKLGPRHPLTLETRNSLAMLASAQGRLAEAESILVNLIPVATEVLGEDHPTVSLYTNNLVGLLSSARRDVEALPLVRRVYDAQRRHHGPRHSDTLDAAQALAGVLEGLGRFAPAESLYLEALAIRRQDLGNGHPLTVAAINNLGFLYRNQKRYAEAEPLFREAWQGFRVALGEKHQNTLTTASNLGHTYNEMGRFAEAEPINAEVLAGLRETLPPDHWLLGTVMAREGVSLRGLGRYAQAEPLLLQGYGLLSEALGPDNPRTQVAVAALADLYRSWGRVQEAKTWQARRIDAVASGQ